MGLRIGEREFNGLRWRRHATAQHSGIEIKKSSNESFAITQHRPLDQSDLEFHACVCQHPCFAPQSADKGCQVAVVHRAHRSEEHTSELQSQSNLVCRLLLEKKK